MAAGLNLAAEVEGEAIEKDIVVELREVDAERPHDRRLSVPVIDADAKVAAAPDGLDSRLEGAKGLTKRRCRLSTCDSHGSFPIRFRNSRERQHSLSRV